MKINGTITTKSGRWSGLKNHVNRGYQHDSNDKSINKKLTKYDKSGCEINVNRIIRKHYGDWLKKRNAKQRRQGNPGRVEHLGDFKAGKKLTNLAIATFGTVDDKALHLNLIENAYPNLGPKKAMKRYCEAVSYGFKGYCDDYNKHNPYLKMGHYTTNSDEKGAPHVHFEIIPLGYTKKGKPSSSFSNAVKRQYKTSDRRKAFREWNNQETHRVVDYVGLALAKRFSKVPQFQQQWHLQHTGRKHSISMEVYKPMKDHARKVAKYQSKVDEHQKKVAKKQAKRRKWLQKKRKQQKLETARYNRQISKKHRKLARLSKKEAKFQRENTNLKSKNGREQLKYNQLHGANSNLERTKRVLTSTNKGLKNVKNVLINEIKTLGNTYDNWKKKLSKLGKWTIKKAKSFVKNAKSTVKSSDSHVDKAFDEALYEQRASAKPHSNADYSSKNQVKSAKLAMARREQRPALKTGPSLNQEARQLRRVHQKGHGLGR